MDLGEVPKFDECCPVVDKKPKKRYPRTYVKKNIPGLNKVGDVVTLTVKAKVTSMELRDGQEPEFGIELREMKVDD